MSYPTRAALAARLRAQDVDAQDRDVESALASAISTWERKTGWRPFVSSGETESRTIPFYGAELLLPPGLAIRSLDEDDEANAGYALGSPAGHGSYRSLGWGYSRSLGYAHEWGGSATVSGVFGLLDEVPAEVSDAILALAVAHVRSAIGSEPAVTREKVGDVEVQYASYESTGAAKLAREAVDELAKAYKAWSF